MTTGYTVEPADLREYSNKLAGGTAKANEIKGLVADADVGDQSWGIVGLFVKDTYTQLLGDLNSLLEQMGQGYQSGADKFRASADNYERYEDEVERLLGDIHVALDT